MRCERCCGGGEATGPIGADPGYRSRRPARCGLGSSSMLFGVILGVVFLNEPLDVPLAGGGALVIVGIAVVNWRPRRSERPGVI